MKSIWQNLIIKIVIWLTAEVLLTFLGLDDLADYGEFIYRQPTLISMSQEKELIT